MTHYIYFNKISLCFILLREFVLLRRKKCGEHLEENYFPTNPTNFPIKSSIPLRYDVPKT